MPMQSMMRAEHDRLQSALPLPRPPILNISGYRFVALDALQGLRDLLLGACAVNGLRGTIVLAPEGINFFLAGTAESIAAFLETIDSDPRLSGMEPKRSWSESIPFRRLKVRIKREIISMGQSGIDPARDPAPALEPEMLRSWLDQGRPLVLLDTRNAFEVERGTFVGARHLGNTSFRDFAEAAVGMTAPGDDVPIVTFCTGGIRCEKAAPLLRRLGHRNVLQLSGGILGYFERAGTAHFRGECFVFDERVALDAKLNSRTGQNPVQL